MPLKKEDTPDRIIKRRYEERNKEERKAYRKQFNTTLSIEFYEELEAFLKENHIAKIDIIKRGYHVFKEDIEKQRKDGKKQNE